MKRGIILLSSIGDSQERSVYAWRVGTRPPTPASSLSLILIAFLGVFGLTGCSTKMPEEEVVRQVMHDSELADGNHAPLHVTSDPTHDLLKWRFHISLSSSMQGFTQGLGPKFPGLLDQLHSAAPLGCSFVGERGLTNGFETNYTKLLRPEFYSESNLDYQSLFGRLLTESNMNHVLFTDGLPLKKNDIMPPAEIVVGLKRFLNSGGDFALWAIQMPFDGSYTSIKQLKETPLSMKIEPIIYQTNARPMLVWIFVQPGQSISTASHPLGRMAEWLKSLVPDATSEAEWNSAYGKWTCLVAPSRGMQPMALVEKKSTEECRLPGLVPIKKLSFVNQPEGIPFTFELSIPVPFNGTNTTNAMRSQDASLVASNDFALSGWEVPQDGGKMKRLGAVEALPEWKIAAPENATANWTKAKLTVTPKRPRADSDDLVWMITVRPNSQLARHPRLDALSTEDDSAPESAGAIYRLDSLLDAIRRQLLVHSRTIFFTHWTN